jgi:hypothetical protein
MKFDWAPLSEKADQKDDPGSWLASKLIEQGLSL